MASGKGGRPPKLDDAVSRSLVAAVALGVPRKYAALQAGIGESTLRSWLQKGKQGESDEYSALLADIKRAEAEALAERVRRIDQAGRGGTVTERVTKTVTDKDGNTETTVTERIGPPQWTADAWWLERRHREHFGRVEPPAPPASAENVGQFIARVVARQQEGKK